MPTLNTRIAQENIQELLTRCEWILSHETDELSEVEFVAWDRVKQTILKEQRDFYVLMNVIEEYAKSAFEAPDTPENNDIFEVYKEAQFTLERGIYTTD